MSGIRLARLGNHAQGATKRILFSVSIREINYCRRWITGPHWDDGTRRDLEQYRGECEDHGKQ